MQNTHVPTDNIHTYRYIMSKVGTKNNENENMQNIEGIKLLGWVRNSRNARIVSLPQLFIPDQVSW